MHLDFLHFLIPLLITGIFSGLLAGLLGVGGGIIIVPVVFYLLKQYGYSTDIIMHVSIASSLGVILLTSMSSIYTHLKLDNVEIKVLKKWVIGVVLGSIVGAIFASSISGDILIIIFVILASVVAINMLLDKNIFFSRELPKNTLLNNTISFFIGCLSAIIGIGGGSFSVPILSAFGKNMHKAVGTSASIGFFIALPGLITYIITGMQINNLPPYSLGYINLQIIITISITSVLIAPLGAKISKKLNRKTLKKIFALFLLMTCVSLIVNQYS
tara:strand:+ start:8964 stop:9779 length:816 start_codon:yes stop_codon:yes gene_type:complete